MHFLRVGVWNFTNSCELLLWRNFASRLKKNPTPFKLTVQILMTPACKTWHCHAESREFTDTFYCASTWGLTCDSQLYMPFFLFLNSFIDSRKSRLIYFKLHLQRYRRTNCLRGATEQLLSWLGDLFFPTTMHIKLFCIHCLCKGVHK